MTQKVLTVKQLAPIIRRLQKKGQSIVFTNGCFDLIHVGHLKVFESCKKFGDVLVVALNSDASVRRLKGPKRPILSYSDRSKLIAGFSVVDFVTSFSEDTPLQIIKELKPDILAKGGDWSMDSIIGRDDVKKVVRIPFVKGRSTSSIIDLIVKRYGPSNA